MPGAEGEPNSARRTAIAIAVVLFVVSLTIRLMGIGWGLRNDLHNQSYHPDEPVIFDFIHHSGIFVHENSTYREKASDRYYSYGTLYLGIIRVAHGMVSTY